MPERSAAVLGSAFPDTVVSRLVARAVASPGAEALRLGRSGEWLPVSWGAYALAVQTAAASLEEAGVGWGSKVVLFADNSLEWLVVDLALMTLGAISVPVYPTSAQTQVAEVARRAGVAAVVVDPTRRGSGEAVTAALPGTRLLVIGAADGLGGLPADGDRAAPTLDRLLSLAERLRPQDVAVLLYTSGATGTPKGVALTHANFCWTAAARLHVTPIDERDRTLCYLPLSHIAGRMNYEVFPVSTGCQVWIGGGFDRVFDDLPASRPTAIFGVPRIFEKVHERLEAAAARVGAEEALRLLGLDQLRYAICGAAPIGVERLERLAALGLQVMELYGQTETTGLTTLNRRGAVRLGTVGRPAPGVEVSIAADGEILVRGGNTCAGYEGDREATSELLGPDGWLRTGDLGRLDDDGYLTIVGRTKDILITAGGKNVYPAPVEQRLRRHPAISEAFLVGDGRPYVAAVVEVAGRDTRDPELLASIAELIEELNEHLSRSEAVKRAVLVERLDPAIAYTATHKLRRSELTSHYAALIDALYRVPEPHDARCLPESELRPAGEQA